MGFKPPRAEILAFKWFSLNNLRSTTGMPFPASLFHRSMTHHCYSIALARGCQLISQAQPPLRHFSKSLGQIQNLEPDHLMSGLKSKTTPGDTLPARPYSYRRLNPKDGSRWVIADDANLDFAANDTEQEVIRNRRKFALRISRSRIEKDSGLSAALVMK
jgi:hypothetical protein